MKTLNHLFTIFACTLLLSSCRNIIVPDDIYGIWTVQEQTTAEKPKFAKLLLNKEGYSWIDPVANDTIFLFKTVEVAGETLLLTDGFDQPTRCIIEELHDSVLTLSHVNGTEKQITYKKVKDSNNKLEKLEEIKASDIPRDSLDVIVKSFLIWNLYPHLKANSKEPKTYHSLTKDEMLQARELLRQYMSDGSLEKDPYDNEDAYPFDQYIRQYMSYVENGHLFVRIELNTSVYASKGIGYTALKQDVFLVEDGGPAHATATIDLTAKKVIVFMTNGNA